MKKAILAIVFGLLGLILGAALGVAGPMGISLFFAWLHGGGPSAGAPTAFYLLIIITLPAGAILGLVAGVCSALIDWDGPLETPLLNAYERQIQRDEKK